MQLKKSKLHSFGIVAKAESQITLDDDYNVPDYRPDIVKVLKKKGELYFDEVKAAAGAAWLKGRLVFYILYRSDQENGKISCLKGEIPFQEKLNMDGVQEFDQIQAFKEVEDLTVGVIHSRKISVRAVILLRAQAQKEKIEEIGTGVSDEIACEQRYRKTKLLQLCCMKKDVCRQKNEITLPSSKSNVREILWKSLELRNIETRLQSEGIRLTGEIQVSVLYQGEEDAARIQWYETTVPLDCMSECKITSMENILYYAKEQLISAELEVKPDYDGEERVFVMEVTIGLDIRIWMEEEVSLLEDLYSLEQNVILECRSQQIDHMLLKNESKCRITEQMALEESQERILQICGCEGSVHLEKTEMSKRGLHAEGILIVELLYITTDDRMPVGEVRGIYPFEQLIELPETEGKMLTELECKIGQLAATMVNQNQAEIKAVIDLNILAFEQEEIENATEIKTEPIDMEKLQNQPGLVGYFIREGDSLWKIAKENHTTVTCIMEDNHRSEEQVKPGEKVLIVKKVK